jgi:serine/threonine-protein kinase
MLAGKRAFGGDSRANMVAAILRDDPPPFVVLQRPVPAPLEQLVRRCLEKRPEDRYQSVHDLALALRAIDNTSNWSAARPRPPRARSWSRLAAAAGAAMLLVTVVLIGAWALRRALERSPAGEAEIQSAGLELPQRKRIAVLPFEVTDPDPEWAILSAGLAEWLAHALTIIEEQSPGDLWTVNPDDARRVALESPNQTRTGFGVNLVLTGTVDWSSGDPALNLILEDASGARIIGRASTTPHRDPCELQRQAVEVATRLLGTEPDPTRRLRIEEQIADNQVACAGHLRGLGLLASSGDPSNVDRAIAALESAVSHDSLHVCARVALVEACRRRFAQDGDGKWLRRGYEHAERAVALASGSPGPWLALAALHADSGRMAESVAALERAAKVAPNRADTELALGKAYLAVGRNDDAEATFLRAIALRPDHWLGHSCLGELYWLVGRRDEAMQQFRLMHECAPESWLAYNNVGAVMLASGDVEAARGMFERSLEVGTNYLAACNLGTLAFLDLNYGEAVKMFEMALSLDESDYIVWGNLGHAYHWTHQPEEARSRYVKAVQLGEQKLRRSPGDPWLLVDLADYHAMLGERDRGLLLLNQAIDLDLGDPEFTASVGEVFEDLGDRQSALEWIGQALREGLDPGWVQGSPSLSSHEEFRALARRYGAAGDGAAAKLSPLDSTRKEER